MSSVQEQMKAECQKANDILKEMEINSNVSTDTYLLAKLIHIETNRLRLMFVEEINAIKNLNETLNSANIWG